jgi:hypothetical protein
MLIILDRQKIQCKRFNMRHQLEFFCIDLDSKCPEVLEYSGQALLDDLEHFGVQDALELDNYDRRVFRTPEEADAYLELYNRTLKSLNNTHICKAKGIPAMLYKRRYIVQTLLGEKLQTYRHYKKPWTPGTLFNLHDQTFFLTVRLKSIEETPDGFKYSFELP